MKNRGKNRRILILMIASQLLLTGFVIQWLNSQFRAERESLVKDLTTFYVESHEAVLDSMLFKSYVNPVLSESRIIVMDHLVTGKDTTNIGSVPSLNPPGQNGRIRMKGKSNESIITVNLSGKCDTIKGSQDTIKIKGMSNDMLLRSVRLIVARSEDTLNMKHSEAGNFSLKMNIDTAVFKKYFLGKLQNTGMTFNIGWKINGTIPSHVIGKKVLYINPLMGTSLPEAEVAGYKGYLFGRILPQIIFGIVLILITALAFMLSYRSIRNQIILNSLRNEFVSNITHELKTPVATLKVALESLGKYNLRNEPAVMDEYMRLASAETKRLEELINKVLDQSVLDEQNFSMQLVATDINNIISEITVSMNQRIDKKGSIEFRYEEEKLFLKCDPLYLRGVLINLVDNSIKYCDKEPVILIKTRINEGYAFIEISDNGPGIPEEYQNKIFEKFFRVPADNIHNVKGYGLGLSFASLVMQKHSGSINVKNLDPGCSFTLKIPLR
jgi:signal transduction histidine kinase